MCIRDRYEYDSNRFESLPVYPSLGKIPKRPKPPVKLSKDERSTLNGICKGLMYAFAKAQCDSLRAKQKRYPELKAQYDVKNAAYKVAQADYQKKSEQLKHAKAAYSDFRTELSSKPEQ